MGGEIKMITINQELYNKMPEEVRVCFNKLPNQSSEEVKECFPETKSGELKGYKIPGSTTEHLSGLKQIPRTKSTKSEGSAARFFYCAKASKSDRNSGLDGTRTVKYNTDISFGEISCQDVNMVLAELLKKVTSESTLKWSIGESGENITGLCQAASLSTTLTTIRRITTSQILSLLMPLLTRDFTADASLETVNGGSHAVNADSLSKFLQTFTPASLAELALGASHAVSKMLSAISAEENWKQATNIHSTVKPTALMRYLCRLVTPHGGTILDPFMGSGSTGKAAVMEGFGFIGIEVSVSH